MMLTKTDNSRGIFIPINAESVEKVFLTLGKAAVLFFLLFVLWNLTHAYSIESMANAVIGSYINTGDSMGSSFYLKLVEFEKSTVFSSGYFTFVNIVFSVGVAVVFCAWLVGDAVATKNEIFWRWTCALAVSLAWFGVWSFSGHSSIELANKYVLQGQDNKSAVVASLKEISCTQFKAYRSCRQRMMVDIDGQLYELTTSKVDFYKEGQTLLVKKEIFVSQLTRNKKINIVFE